ncbi:MAG: hypothetical protein KKH88_04295 [Nanoarchaeota archaeon]|nr:hypothetical protein [Nanoarchaeota archaeon]
MKKLIILVILVFISGCSFNGDYVFELKEVDSEGYYEAYFCQVEDCESVLVNLIEGSSKVRCAIFDLDLENVTNALKQKDYKLVVDQKNTKDLDGLKYVMNKGESQLMHNKFCIFDDKIVWTGSMNPTGRGAYYNDNHIVIFYSKEIAQVFNDEFNELYGRTFGWGRSVNVPSFNLSGTKVQVHFCPEDFCEETVLDLIENANEIRFMTFSFTSDKIGDALLLKEDVKGVFEKSQASQEWSEYHKLKDKFDVRLDTNGYNMHHKVFIFDKKIVVFGSYNPTANGNLYNDENMIVVYDEELAGRFLVEFERIY